MARTVPEGLAGYNALQKFWTAIQNKLQGLKTSEIDNDGDGTSPFATQAYVGTNGGKIDKIKSNGTELTITDKAVNIPAASTSAYGVTKLSTSTSGTSTSLAATESAVKAAYDNGGVKSVNGSTGAVSINAVPTGGSTGQVLTKTSSGYGWSNSGGGFVISGSQPTDTSLLWIDSTNNLLKYYSGGSWKAISGVWG